MRRLGISIYPEHATHEEIIRYIDKAHQLGYERIFTCLISQVATREGIEQQFGSWTKYAETLGFEIVADVSPDVFKTLDLTIDDLSFFKSLGLSGIRLDLGFSGQEESQMSFNPYGLCIELNMSNGTKYIDNILSYQPNKSKIIACHNFYPHRYTGLSRKHFDLCSKQFKELGIRTAGFVNASSAQFGPWPVSEGLCTLESHRTLPIETQAKDLFNSGHIDDVIIANMFASDEELETLASVNREKLMLKIECQVALTPVEEAILFDVPHFNRGDVSDYVIRSTQSRVIYKNEVLALKNAVDMAEGDVIIESSLYARYSGELQMALNAMTNSGKSSVVARVVPEERFLIHQIRPWQSFGFISSQK